MPDRAVWFEIIKFNNKVRVSCPLYLCTVRETKTILMEITRKIQLDE